MDASEGGGADPLPWDSRYFQLAQDARAVDDIDEEVRQSSSSLRRQMCVHLIHDLRDST